MALIGPSLRSIGTAVWLVWRAARGIWLRCWQRDPLAVPGLAQAIARFVWGPLPTIAALSALIGLLSGVLVARILSAYNAELLVIGTLVDVLFRQVLPLVIGIFVSGGIAVELTARLGAMTLANEIEALESMGHDPAAFVLGPQLLAIVIASPLHMAVAAAAAAVAAWVPIHLSADIPWRELVQIVLSDKVRSALLTGVAKSLLFALIAFAVGAATGSRAVRVPSDIGRGVSLAFRTGLLAIFAAATLWVSLA